MENPKLRPLEIVPFLKEGRRHFLLRDRLGIAQEVVLSEKAFLIVSFFDGKRDLRGIQVEFMRRYGELLFLDELEKLVNFLDSCFLLETERFKKRYEEVLEEWKKKPLREPAFRGLAYPEEEISLREFLHGFLKDPPENLPSTIRGIIAPHIDLYRGGSCYGAVYGILRKMKAPKIVVIFGTSHLPMKGPFAFVDKDFSTPLGLLKTNREILDQLKKFLPYDPLEESFLHSKEHTIEFQLLFLQLLWKADFEILPVLCRAFDIYLEGKSPEEDEPYILTLRSIRDFLQGKEALVVASADLAHVGPQFGDPYLIDYEKLLRLKLQDEEMLAFVQKGDAQGFLNYIRNEGDRRRICGLPPIYAVLKVLEPVSGKLIDYGQWQDPQGYGSVSFCGMILF
jgi:AmmeMemoRadiSam system protein B